GPGGRARARAARHIGPRPAAHRPTGAALQLGDVGGHGRREAQCAGPVDRVLPGTARTGGWRRLGGGAHDGSLRGIPPRPPRTAHDGETMTLTDSDIEAFVRNGFVRVPGAVPEETALACRDELWRASGCHPDDPATWTRPVIRIASMSTPPFVAAARAQP